MRFRAALMARTETVDKNALRVDALHWLDECLAAIALPPAVLVRCCSPSRQEPFAETRLKIVASGRMDRREESYKIVRVDLDV